MYLSLAIFYLSWASGMTGVRGVAALFLDSIWSSILPISFLRSLAAGSTVSQTLTNKKSVLSVSANQSTALPGVVQLGLSLTCGTKDLLTWKLETNVFCLEVRADNVTNTFQCTHVVCPEFCLLSQGDVGCMNFEWHDESDSKRIAICNSQWYNSQFQVSILYLWEGGLTEDWSMSTSDEPRKPQVQSQVL